MDFLPRDVKGLVINFLTGKDWLNLLLCNKTWYNPFYTHSDAAKHKAIFLRQLAQSNEDAMMIKQYNLFRWNPKLATMGHVIIMGPACSGKTTMVHHLVKNLKVDGTLKQKRIIASYHCRYQIDEKEKLVFYDNFEINCSFQSACTEIRSIKSSKDSSTHYIFVLEDLSCYFWDEPNNDEQYAIRDVLEGLIPNITLICTGSYINSIARSWLLKFSTMLSFNTERCCTEVYQIGSLFNKITQRICLLSTNRVFGFQYPAEYPAVYPRRCLVFHKKKNKSKQRIYWYKC